MRKVTVVLVVASSLSLIPVVASAQTAQYANRGQCESALKQQRNDDRAAASPLTNPGTFNQSAKTNPAYQCVPVYDQSGKLIGYNQAPIGVGV